MPYYVYILKSKKDNKYYIGSTSDVLARLNFHNAGLQRSTKKRVPFELVLFEEYDLLAQLEKANDTLQLNKKGGINNLSLV